MYLKNIMVLHQYSDDTSVASIVVDINTQPAVKSNIYSSAVLEYKIEVLELNLSISIILLLRYILNGVRTSFICLYNY